MCPPLRADFVHGRRHLPCLRSPVRLFTVGQMTRKRSVCWRKLRRAQWDRSNEKYWKTVHTHANLRTDASPMLHQCFIMSQCNSWVRMCMVRPIPLDQQTAMHQGSFNAREEQRLKRLHEMAATSGFRIQSSQGLGIMLLYLLMCWCSILNDSMIYEWRQKALTLSRVFEYWHYTVVIWKFLAPTCMELYSGQERCTDFGGAATTKEPVRPDAGLTGFVRHFCWKTRYISIHKTWADCVCRIAIDSYGFWICWKLLVWNLIANILLSSIVIVLGNGLAARCRSGAMWMCLSWQDLWDFSGD